MHSPPAFKAQLPHSLAHSGLVEAPFQAIATPDFPAWLAAQNAVIVVSTYESGRLLFFGIEQDGQLVNTARTFERAMGLCMNRESLHLATLHQAWHFRNLLSPGQTLRGYDVLYAPRTCHVTGLLDIHDMAIETTGAERVVFANTLYSCVATFEDGYSFRPLWRPPWISSLAPEDRCHLNGLGLRDGRFRYVTAVGRTDTREGWRAGRVGGGVLWDVVEDRAIAENLTMPHSPRWHNGSLYFINAGSGYLCSADLFGGVTELCFCPGFARGLTLVGNFALVGISAQRQSRTFSDLPLDANLRRHNARADRCALLVIDLGSGQIVHDITFTGSINELYDVAVLPGARRANAIGFQKDDILYAINIAPED